MANKAYLLTSNSSMFATHGLDYSEIMCIDYTPGNG